MPEDHNTPVDQSGMGYEPEAPPCRHCGAFLTHFTEYHGDYDCHCDACGRVFMSREAMKEAAKAHA